MSEKIKILIAEDSPTDAELLVRKLRRSGFDCEWQRVDTEDDYLRKLNPDIQLILSDFSMPEFSALRALELLKQRPTLDIPFIIVSGAIYEEIGVAAMREGATDYLLKDRLARLGESVRRALEEVSERALRKRLEDQFLEAQKMEIVGQLACGIAHNFNNALSVVMSYSELVLNAACTDQPQRKQVQQIQFAAERAAGIARQLLVVSRKQQVQPAVVRINEFVNGMEEMLHGVLDDKVELKFLYRSSSDMIRADSSQVWQVLLNLVINARDAMPDGGNLTVETADIRIDDQNIQMHPGTTLGYYVVLGVIDSGIGMSEEVKARLFEPFFTTKPVGMGTGLGLATCRLALQQAGGHIEVFSQSGNGTTIKIYFPMIGLSQSSDVDLRIAIPVPRGASETILLVEDEPSLRHLVQEVLAEEGYNVLTASNGKDAIGVSEGYDGEAISLVLSDLNMPLMGGKRMTECLRAKSPNLKVLFTSGMSNDEYLVREGTQTSVSFLPKPFNTPTLVRNVRQVLDGVR